MKEKKAEENMILCDIKDRAYGQMSSGEAHLISNFEKGFFHRSFSVIMFNSKDEMLIIKPKTNKTFFPGQWTNSCSGHVRNEPFEADEWNFRSYKYAAIRALNEQLGIANESLCLDDLCFMMRAYYKVAAPDGVHGEHELTAFLVMFKDVEIKPNPNEIKEVRWVSKKEFFYGNEEFVSKCLF